MIWAIGIDGGGTRGRAWAAPAPVGPTAPGGGPHDGGLEPAPAGAAAIDGSCNPYVIGAEAAADALVAVARAALDDASAPEGVLAEAFVTIGVAGVDRPSEREALLAALTARGMPGARLELLADPWIALEGALPAAVHGPRATRVLLVGGTGSVAVCVDGALRHRVGGWGPRVGDEGSGGWLGMEAVRATLRALDGREVAGPLAAAVQRAWGEGADALVGRSRAAGQAEFAALAPLVLDQAADDSAAEALRARAAAYLAELLRTAAARSTAAPTAVALVGGVAEALEREIVTLLPDEVGSAVRPPAAAPVAGALALALRRARAAPA